MALLLVAAVLTAGCLGGGDEGKPKKQEFVEAKGTTGAEGQVEALAQASPETVSTTVDLIIPQENITALDFVIKVEDGDDGTNTDQVSGGGLDGAGGRNETIPGGPTPYTTNINIKASEEQNLPTKWTLSLEVICEASDSRTLGIILWVGTPDYGFSYNVTVTYTYLTAAE